MAVNLYIPSFSWIYPNTIHKLECSAQCYQFLNKYSRFDYVQLLANYIHQIVDKFLLYWHHILVGYEGSIMFACCLLVSRIRRIASRTSKSLRSSVLHKLVFSNISSEDCDKNYDSECNLLESWTFLNPVD